MLDRHLPAEAPDRLAALRLFVETTADRVLKRWRKALCLSNEDRDALKATLHAAAEAVSWDELGKAKRKRLLARPAWPAAARLLDACDPGGLIARIERDATPLREEGLAPEPLLSGEDLIAAGLKPGPRFGQLLEKAYDAQLEGELTHRDQAKEWLNRQSRD
jgi:hypothetical protein